MDVFYFIEKAENNNSSPIPQEDKIPKYFSIGKILGNLCIIKMLGM
tara:strand:+ start:224677 stop:224814 length:138 start_codon:yes stop_codon:yes gene_type:complete